jgi:hypothetical protein
LHWLITGEGNPTVSESSGIVTTAELEILRRLKEYGVDVAEFMSLMLEVAILADQKGFVLDWAQTPLTLMMRKMNPAEESASIRLGMPIEEEPESPSK